MMANNYKPIYSIETNHTNYFINVVETNRRQINLSHLAWAESVALLDRVSLTRT